MALETYRVEGFKGIDQSRSENKLNSGYSPDAVNMDTENGDLAVGHGYSRHIDAQVPGAGKIRRMHLWHRLEGDVFVVVAGAAVYAHRNGAWEEIHAYAEGIQSAAWDILETRIGNTDYLLIANGETQMIKWDGSAAAELFGSGEFVYSGEISAVAYNGTRALAVTYEETEIKVEEAPETSTETDETGTTTTTTTQVSTVSWTTATVTLTMPEGWTHRDGEIVAFTMPQDMGFVKEMTLVIGDKTYVLTYVPIWSSGDLAAAVLTSETEAVPYEEKFGVDRVHVTPAIQEEWVARAMTVGVQLDGITYGIDSVSEDRTELMLSVVATTELSEGMSAKVRGEISNHPVNFIEMYYNRLFAAGDPDHPSRLYWSQPPGDTRSIEDWSMDDVSDATGGGFVEVGQTASDPIVGLCALPNQLIIYKQTSVYRLLGDRPSNYRVVAVNRDLERMVNTAHVLYGDVPYWMTRAGMYYHDGQSAKLAGNARQIQRILETADLTTCKAAENRDRLYFTLRQGDGEYDDAMIVYDTKERAYMLRNGFDVADIAAHDGVLYMINSNRYVYKWDKSSDYDGVPIEAHWQTPLTDAGAMSITKALKWLYLRGEGGAVVVTSRAGKFAQTKVYQMPQDTGDVLRLKLENEGRVFSLRITNQAGSWFRLLGGVDIRFEMKEDG